MGKRTNTQKNRTHKGGRFIDAGGFGCTFAFPPLPCWDPRGGPATRRSPDQISKLMYQLPAQEAVLKNRMFRHIDPTQKYFISTSDTDRCRPDLGATDPSDQLDKCHLNTSKPVDLLFFEFGGTSLEKLTLSANEYVPFFKSLYNILEGMTLAHSQDIVHHDIKPGNIVTRALPSGKFQTRIIDFDLANDLKSITFTKLAHLDRQYLFYPFEAIFVNRANYTHFFPTGYVSQYKRTQTSNQLRQVLKQWYDIFQGDYVKGFVLGNGQPFSHKRQQQIGFTLYDSIYKPTLSLISTSLKDYLKSIDVYMMGYTLGLVLNKFFNCVMVCEDKAAGVYKIAFKIVTPQGWTYLYTDEVVANGFSQEAQTWFQNLESWVLIPYAQMVEKMTSWDLTKRLTMDEARYRYGQLLLSMEMFFTEDKITQFLEPLGAVKLKAQPVLPDVPSPLEKIQVSPASPNTNRPYQIPPTNLRKIATNLFEGGKRRRKTQKKRGRK